MPDVGTKKKIQANYKRDEKNEDGEVCEEVLLPNIDLLNYCQECKENAKSLGNVIQENKNVQGINDDKMLDMVPMLQDVEVDLILVNLKVS